MSEKLEFYKCSICGNLVEVVLEGSGELVCCGKPMELLKSNTLDTLGEKHVPIFEKQDDELLIKIGAEPHPMTDEHYIQFIECISNDKRYIKRKYLYPNEEAILNLKCYDIGKMTAKEFCNIHGLWEKSND
jgi:superoxide reductase